VPLKPNQTLLHYRIVEKIGEGGMGEVYLAEDTKLGRRIALKLLPPAMANDLDRLRRFQREARAVAALTHPNIVTLHSVEEDDTSTGSMHFLTMEWVDGESLRQKIPKGGLPPQQVMKFGLPVARALAVAHERGITHRDLKPDNIMVGRDGIPKVLDFGLAKIEAKAGDPTSDETRSVTERITREGAVMGTVAYMAPEQVKGLPLDARSDIFSFGVVLYEMATGRQPFASASAAETMSAILRDEPETLEHAAAGTPLPFAPIVERCLRKEPTQRYASAGELTAALEAIELTGAGTASGLNAPSVTEIRRVSEGPGSSFRNKAPWIASFVAALALIAAGVWYFGGDTTEPAEPTSEASVQRIVVLPFENLGAPEDAYFAAGLTEEITNRLGSIGRIRVISRRTASKYRDTDLSVAELGVELGVDFILDGSVRWQKTGDAGEVRVTAQLIQVEDDTHVWSDKFDRALADIFEVQSQIAAQVAGELNINLVASEKGAIDSVPTSNMAAYEAYLRGIDISMAADGTVHDQTELDMFRNAVRLDPDFAEAWAWLSSAHSLIYASGRDRSAERRASAKAGYEKALQLKPGLPIALSAQAYYEYWVELRYEDAIDTFAKARQGLPSDTRILAGMAYAARRAHRLDDAKRYLQQAIELDPADAYLYVEHALTYTYLREYDESLKIVAQSLEQDPDQYTAQFILAQWSTLATGDVEAGTRWASVVPRAADSKVSSFWFWRLVWQQRYADAADHVRSVDLPNLDTWWYTRPKSLLLGLGLRFDGRDQEAAAAFEQARIELEQAIAVTPPDDFMGRGKLHGALALALAGLGRKDEAIRESETAIEHHSYDRDLFADGRLIEQAMVYALLGETDRALAAAEYLLSIPSIFSIHEIALNPAWEPVRDDPRFAELRAKYGG
jgi:TolB-like protein/tRNA A-37 threonylcarbamoyl transferase component Bud32